MSERSIVRQVLVLWACLALLVAACGDSTDSGSGTTGSDDTSTGPSTSSSGGEGTASEGGGATLTVASVESLDNWDPLQQANPSYVSLVYDTLVAYSPDGLELQPRLATDWETGPDFLEFTLRDDAVFHDGAPIDGEAVAMNIQRMQDTPHSAQSAFAPISDIIAVDDTTVRIELSTPAGGILEELAGWIGSIVAPAAIEEGSFQMPIGSAGFLYNDEASEPGVEVVLDAFSDYYAAENVGPERIEYLEIFDAEQRYNALQTGDVDVIYGTGGLADQAETDGFDVRVYPKVFWSVMLTDTEGTFQDENVRHAVCSAIDPQGYLDAQFNGYGEVYSQPFPEGAPGHNPSIDGYTYDLETAQGYMADAGNPSISVTIPTSEEYLPIAQVFAAQMAEIGITVDLNVMSFGEYFGAYNSADVPMILFSTAADTGPYSYYTRRFHPDGSLNPQGLEFPELTALVEEGAAAPDPETSNESWMALTQAIVENSYDCGTWGIPGFWISNPDTVTNIVPTNYQIDNFRYTEAEVLD